MAERYEPTLTDLRVEWQRLMTTRGLWSVRDLLLLHLLGHAEVTQRPEAIAAIRALRESRP